MVILFYHKNGIVPTLGGISRITYTLTKTFRSNGHIVYLLGGKRVGEYDYDNNQLFLPEATLSDKDVAFASDFITKNNIDVIVNQFAIDKASVDFIQKVAAVTEVKVWSCIHNSILTQIYNFAYQKEYQLNKNNLGWVANILKNRIVANILTCLYIAKKRNFYKSVVENSDKVVLLSFGHRKELEKMCGSEKLRNAIVIPNCIEGVPYTNDSNKKNIVLWVGSIDFSVKRLDLMLRIWEKVQHKATGWELKILGSSDYLDEAKTLSKNLNLRNVTFEGRVNPEKYYRDAKIICVTSTHESFSLVTVEGMMNGCVPIVFNSFPTAESIIEKEVSGILVKAFDTDVFAQRLLSLMNSNLALETMANNAREKSKNYIPEKIYNQWAELINPVAKQ